MSSLSTLNALSDSSSVDVAPTLFPSPVAVAARNSGTSQAPSSFQSRSNSSLWYSPHQSDQSGCPSSTCLHKMGPFDMINKHFPPYIPFVYSWHCITGSSSGILKGKFGHNQPGITGLISKKFLQLNMLSFRNANPGDLDVNWRVSEKRGFIRKSEGLKKSGIYT